MNRLAKTGLVGLVVLMSILTLSNAYASDAARMEIKGVAGFSRQWGSGWIDLASVRDFEKGETLELKIGGTAKTVVVRLLEKGKSPDSRDGILGAPAPVPKSRVIRVPVKSTYRNIIQISVHGGPNPWGAYPLGTSNGPATLESAAIILK